VKWVKTDTASIWIENGIGEQVVDIYEHRAQHYQTSIFPVFFPEKASKNKRYQ
jgi:hypothetical protein